MYGVFYPKPGHSILCRDGYSQPGGGRKLGSGGEQEIVYQGFSSQEELRPASLGRRYDTECTEISLVNDNRAEQEGAALYMRRQNYCEEHIQMLPLGEGAVSTLQEKVHSTRLMPFPNH